MENAISGCPLGPLLRNSFQNDLTYTTEEEIPMYAEYHQMFASAASSSIVEGI